MHTCAYARMYALAHLRIAHREPVHARVDARAYRARVVMVVHRQSRARLNIHVHGYMRAHVLSAGRKHAHARGCARACWLRRACEHIY